MRGMQAFMRCPQRANAHSMSLLPSYVYMRGLGERSSADRRLSNVMQCIIRCIICMVHCRLLITQSGLRSACYGSNQMLEETCSQSGNMTILPQRTLSSLCFWQQVLSLVVCSSSIRSVMQNSLLMAIINIFVGSLWFLHLQLVLAFVLAGFCGRCISCILCVHMIYPAGYQMRRRLS